MLWFETSSIWPVGAVGWSDLRGLRGVPGMFLRQPIDNERCRYVVCAVPRRSTSGFALRKRLNVIAPSGSGMNE